jgi:UDP-2,3-diacylglucosamine hydrolase
MSAGEKLGLIAGGGGLPVALCGQLQAQATPFFAARLQPYVGDALAAFPGADFNLGQIGGIFERLRAEGCFAVCFAGLVSRVDPATLQLDALTISLLPRVLAGLQAGDDALLRIFVEAAEEAGFTVLGAEQAAPEILAPAGAMGALGPGDKALRDIRRAAQVAAAVGAWDVGQGVVVCDGVVLAVEAQEGTDQMLKRVAALPPALRGDSGARRGVLVKRPKPGQERRIDMPTIGLATVEAAAAAGLIGVAVEAGGALVLQRAEAVALADAAGLFLFGFGAEDAG